MTKKKIGAAFLTAAYLLGAALLHGNGRLRPENSVLLFLAALSILCAACFWRALAREEMRPYLRGRLCACLLTSAYASFASFGYRLFLEGERIHIDAPGVLLYILGTLWFFPVIVTMLYALEAAGRRICARTPGKRSIRLPATLLCLACFFFALSVFYPGFFSIDAVQQFSQARGNEALTDAHPVMHTMIIRLLLSICDSEVFVLIVQALCFALLAGRLAEIARRSGVPGWIVLPGIAVFCLLPNQVWFQLSPLKDVLFTTAMLWGTLLLFELALDETRLCRPGFLVQLVLSMLLTGTLRHNGLAPMALMLALLIAIALRRSGRIRRSAVSAVCACLALLGLWKGPALTLLGAQPNDATPYLTMFCAAGSVVNKGGTLSEENMERLESVMPLEDWAEYYSPFMGHDRYVFERPDGMDLTGFTPGEALAVYLDALARYPDIVIKDRLDGANLLWDVTQPAESYLAKGVDYILISSDAGFEVPGGWEGECFMNRSTLAQIYRKLANFAFPGEEERGQLSNMLLWRAGAYQIFLLVLLIYWKKNGLRRMRWVMLPLAGNNLILIFGLYYQAYRYICYVQVLAVALLLCTGFMLRRAREQGGAGPEFCG